MSIAPPSEGVKMPPTYGPKQAPGAHPEGGGVTVVCVCKWLRWFADENSARDGRREHDKKCKGEPVAAEPTMGRPPRARGGRR